MINDIDLINDHLGKIRNRLFKEFKNLEYYEICVEKLKKEKELKELFDSFTDIDSIADRILKFEIRKYDFEKEVLTEIKYGIVLDKMLDDINLFKRNVKGQLDAEAIKLLNKEDKLNPNIVNFSIDEELIQPEFKTFVYDNLNLDGKLEQLLKEKNKNETIIILNKQKIKNDEKKHLENFICVNCHLRERNAVSKQCPHLMLCDECIKYQKVCPRCGVNIDSYDKVYRS